MEQNWGEHCPELSFPITVFLAPVYTVRTCPIYKFISLPLVTDGPERYPVLGPILKTVSSQILRPQKAPEYRPSFPEKSGHSSVDV